MDSLARQKMQPATKLLLRGPYSFKTYTARWRLSIKTGNLFRRGAYSVHGCVYFVLPAATELALKELHNDGINSAGPPLRTACTAQVATVYLNCADHTGAGDCRECDDLHLCG